MALTTTELRTGLWRWTTGSPPLGPVNSYALLTPDGLVLIDPAPALTPARLTEAGIRQAVRLILLTHVQREHAGGAANFPGVPVAAPAGSEHLLQGEAAYRQLIGKWEDPWDWTERGNYPGHLAGAANERPLGPLTNPTHALTPGSVVMGLHVLATPGHAKHAVTLLTEHRGARLGFCGDVICGDGQLANWFDCDWDYGPQTGQRTLLNSINTLSAQPLHLLLPTHGSAIEQPHAALTTLRQRLETVLDLQAPPAPPVSEALINFAEVDSPMPGFRQLSPHLHQWRTGNCAVLVSRSGAGLLVDCGWCCWAPLPARRAHHQQVIAQLKQALKLTGIEVAIPTHYHGDHTEQLPDLRAQEGARIVSLEVVADAIEHPERFNLCCPLPWYDAGHDVVPVDQRMREGEVLRWHEYELTFFHLGGQTYYHAGISAEIDGQQVCFVGDAVGGQSPARPAVLTYNDAEPYERGWAYSHRRILERAPELLVAGHGIALRQPGALLTESVRLWEAMRPTWAALAWPGDLRTFFDPFLSGGAGCWPKQL